MKPEEITIAAVIAWALALMILRMWHLRPQAVPAPIREAHQ